MKPQIYRLLWTIALLCVGQPQAALTQDLSTRFANPPDLVAKVGRRIWLNESEGDEQAITAWNNGEDFMSLELVTSYGFRPAAHLNSKRAFRGCWSFFRQRE